MEKKANKAEKKAVKRAQKVANKALKKAARKAEKGGNKNKIKSLEKLGLSAMPKKSTITGLLCLKKSLMKLLLKCGEKMLSAWLLFSCRSVLSCVSVCDSSIQVSRVSLISVFPPRATVPIVRARVTPRRPRTPHSQPRAAALPVAPRQDGRPAAAFLQFGPQHVHRVHGNPLLLAV